MQVLAIGLSNDRLLALGVSHNGCVSVSHFVCLFCLSIATYVGDDRQLSALWPPTLKPIFLKPRPSGPGSWLFVLAGKAAQRPKCSLNNLKLIGFV